MGAVLRSTCILKPIRKKFAEENFTAHITWITLPNAKALLENNPEIDRLLVLNAMTIPVLKELKFDVVYALDKSLEAGALAEMVVAKEKFGFGLTQGGVIRPMTDHAQYQYDLGLDDEMKFKINKMPETEQIAKTLDLPYSRDEYILELTESEKRQSQTLRAQFFPEVKGVIGYNTGCSVLFPYKKFTIERAVEVIQMWRKIFPDYAVALFGGREDEERQNIMKSFFLNDARVVNTPTTGGLREGIIWMDTCDILFSGCSLGLHIGIGLKKQVIAWFGVSCIQEIDVFNRGVKIQSDVSCSPCWKKSCTNEPKCFNQVSVEVIQKATEDILAKQIS